MGSQFGAEFLTNPAHATELSAALTKSTPDGSIPEHFQVLLRTEAHDNVMPTKGTIEIIRIL